MIASRMRIQTALAAIAITIVTVPAFAGTTFATETFKVVGVAANDSLNIRDGIPQVAKISDASVLGTIPANATDVEGLGISVRFKDQVWKKVRHGDTVGWVAARFLARDNWPDKPENLTCSGTEPFWSLSLAGAGATFKRLGGGSDISLSIATSRRGHNRVNLWTYDLVGGSSPINALVVHNDQCSDGMSDFTYAFEIYLQGAKDGEGALQGCCFYAH